MRKVSTLTAYFAILFIAGCAVNAPASGKKDVKNPSANDIFNRQGRISLRVDSEPPQSLSGAFAIRGDAQVGDLSLNSPLGNTLAQLSWTPQYAELKAQSEVSRFDSTEALLLQVTGTTLPLAALFDWLAGKDTPVAGWQVDVSQLNNPDRPRLNAKRLEPLPVVDLRIVLEP